LILKIFFFCASLFFVSQNVMAFQASPFSAQDSGLPSYHPRLSGGLVQFRMLTESAPVVWTGTGHHSRGVIHAWGESPIHWGRDESLEEMDLRLRRLVDLNQSAFKIQGRDLRLSRERTKFAGAQRTLVYERIFWFEGETAIPLESAFVIFRFKNHRLVQITNHSYGDVGIIEAPMVSSEEALEAVLLEHPLQSKNDQVKRRAVPYLQAFFIRGGEVRFRMIYQVEVFREASQSLWTYRVSGRDASVLAIDNGLHSSQILGSVIPRLPRDGVRRAPMPFAKVTSGRKNSSADQRGEYNYEGGEVIAELTSSFVTLHRNGKPVRQLSSDSTGIVEFDAAKALDDSNAFFHITRLNGFVRQFIRLPFLDRPIHVNTQVKNGAVESCNAWFSPFYGTLNFLRADDQCENSSHLADIVYHEWGHALDHAIGGIQDSAFSEAIGDVTSLLMTGDPQLARGFVKSKPESGIRDMAQVKVYPRDRHSNPHTEGLIVGGAWFETFTLMKEVLGEEAGRQKTADLFFRHLVSADDYLDSYYAALVVDDDDGDLSNCTPHMCLLNKAFSRRGLTPQDPRCQMANACGSSSLILD
jgi:hypothetical protein